MLSSLPLEALLAIGRQRWLLAVMARFHALPGQRFAELLRALKMPRDSLSRTLEAATSIGWIARNPGHGHPLRPEYLVTEAGLEIAQAAARIAALLTEHGIAPDQLTRWSLPVLFELNQGRERFNDVLRGLAPLTPRALSQTLHTLAALGLISREVQDGFPPTSRYCLTALGAKLYGLESADNRAVGDPA